ncbi:MAG TPA: tagaturonate reductase [Longimicrobiaceae bacterium]|nr:tagaturonate reductase [Longimicrobiaceae bacterium]
MTLPKLGRALIENGHPFPPELHVDREHLKRERPARVLQFGEGNFLRGFVDWMIDHLNRDGLFDGGVTIVQPIEQGMVGRINAQDGLYTLVLRGMREGRVVEQKELIGAVRGGIDPYTNYDAFLAAGRDPELRFVVSNTTEAGIAFDPSDRATDRPAASFPGKLTALLHERWRHFGGDPARGLVIIPCELIERNGDNLRRCVLRTAEAWELEPAFRAWVEDANVFTNTLVDRIVTGYPREEAPQIEAELGYRDDLLDTGEIFHAWVIEGPAELADELPFSRAGLNVVWTDDVTPYRDRKVRILNGAHTMMVLAAYLAGKDTVKECMDDPAISDYLRHGLYDEIIPTLDLPRADLESFAAAVLERFANPFVRHELLSISLNSTSKFKARVLPSVEEYLKRRGEPPRRLSFSLAALIAFYRGTEIRDGALVGHRGSQEYPIRDDAPVLEFFRGVWSDYDRSEDAGRVATAVLARASLWGQDLTALPGGFAELVAADLRKILDSGAEAAMAAL